MDLSVWLFSNDNASAMILSARILHEKTPDKRTAILNFLADTGGVSFHWPFFIIFSRLFGKWWQPLNDHSSDSSGSVLLFWTSHCRQKTSSLRPWRWISAFDKPIFTSLIPLALLMIGISAFPPTVGAFDMGILVVSRLNQADSKCRSADAGGQCDGSRL